MFNASDQFAFKAGDTIGFWWTEGCVIPYDYQEIQVFCEHYITFPIEGKPVNLVTMRNGNKMYSLQAFALATGKHFFPH